MTLRNIVGQKRSFGIYRYSLRMGKDMPKHRNFPTLFGRVITPRQLQRQIHRREGLRKQNESIFYTMLPDFRKKTLLFVRFPGFCVCPSDKNSMKKSMEH